MSKEVDKLINDEYSHITEDIFYIEENIPGPLMDQDPDSFKIHSEYNSQRILHCKCSEGCNENDCQCLGNNKINYHKYENELLATQDILVEDNLILECNDLCSCSKFNCGNRLVQYGPRKGLKIDMCPIACNRIDGCQSNTNKNLGIHMKSNHTQRKGLGLFTESPILKGGYICEYAGELLSKSEAIKRSKINDESKLMNYIICLNEFTNGSKVQTFIDPCKFGNIGRYMNHSCEQNCTMLPVRVNSTLPKLCLFANRNIEAGSELTFSYGSVFESDSNFKNRIECLCLSDKCRKWLPNCDFQQ